MNTPAILQLYHTTQIISEEIIASIQNDKNLRIEMVNFFAYQGKDREFAYALLDKFIAMRKQAILDMMPFEDLMFACYVLGLHKEVEDSAKIWEAKYVDFDTYCGLDVQLVAFAGKQKTLDFLRLNGFIKAYDCLIYCITDDDFDPRLEDYFNLQHLPWYI
ncbi:hypothetical protein [Mucilaginibacter ginsenosidivorans]|uniref:Uncharacterized protein n=1 Tax=Mucilaginibacter ginsenosidivorans TaxID=398053 RepID=A0A5B8UQV4_9SPHI|nr:hypothetical protein [Mucilaginibacter ginsenosidivorans]QEC61477.1 hypothetical protein FRZ54_02375 [Mucilaginibacter ginsenosidivorans]